MDVLGKDAILSAQDKNNQIVSVPEWGGHVNVRVMSGTERDSFEAGLMGDGGKVNTVNIRARLCSLCICDAEGKRMFTTDADIKLLGDKSAAALDRVFMVAQKINGITAEDVDALAKN
jgi:hypothetical protein